MSSAAAAPFDGGRTPNGDVVVVYGSNPPSSSSFVASPFSIRAKQYLSHIRTWDVWKAILLGQVISLLNCATAISSQYLSQTYKVNAPTAQSFLNYVLLCTFYTTCLACKAGDQGLISVLRARGWKYFLLAIVDVEANYLVVKAYQHTTLTSVQLLDCFTIPTVLALSWIFLKVRYALLHILGVGVCLLGVGCVVWSDVVEGKGNEGGDDRFLGDMLCLAGAALYGVSNVGEEFLVKNFNRVETLGMLGLFGSVINGIQLAILERHEVATMKWDTWQIVACLVGFAVALFAFYSIVPFVMRLSSATAVNLSILSCDFYSLVAAIFLFRYQFHILYLCSFLLVILGVVIYSVKPTASTERNIPTYREVLANNCDNVELPYGHSLPVTATIRSPPYVTCGQFWSYQLSPSQFDNKM